MASVTLLHGREVLYPALGTLGAVLVYQYHTFQVGKARGRLGIKPPATTGNPEFERYFRVQMNTLEQIVMFLPAMWVFAAFVSPKGALAASAAWTFARVCYGQAYYRDPERRVPWAVLSFFNSYGLVLTSAYFVTSKLLQQ
jgi:glutathione S-transferase